jgi:8-oxo-dGTP pyrophosphatase MutT (NUDIX family)
LSVYTSLPSLMSPFALSVLRTKLCGAKEGPKDEPGNEPAAAVGTILRESPEGAEVLLIKRAERDGDPWSGHLAFPGGKREPTDASLLATCIRETEEEVGLRLPPASLLARLDDVRARTNGYRVAQFVFALDDPGAKVATNAEVAAVLWVPLSRIEADEGKETMQWNAGGRSIELPCVRLGEHVLWGMTYRMVSQVIALAR